MNEMIEVVVIGHLNSVLAVQAYGEEPETVAESYVLVEKTGSGNTNHVNTATIAVQSYAGSMAKAAELNYQVIGAMKALAEDNRIGRVKLNSDYNFTDTKTKRYRYQAVFDISYLEEVNA